MDFKQIEAFINVAKFKSFSKAADAIFLSQPTISAHISSLEDELGVSLFNRNGKEISLTPSGSVFLEYAANLINTRDNAVLKLSSFSTTIKGPLTIASSTTPCRFILPRFIKSFRKIYDKVNYNIKEGSSTNVLNMIISGESDIGFVGETVNDKRIQFIKVAHDNLIAISNISTLPKDISLDLFLKQDFILREKGSATRNAFKTFLEKSKIPLGEINIIAEVNSLEAVLQFVKFGLGVSIISEAACADYINAGIIKKHNIKNVNIKRDIYMVTFKNRIMTPQGKAFYEHIINNYALPL